jgi:F-type H+-transporting ATPase subunit b
LTFSRLPLLSVFLLCFGLSLGLGPGKAAWALQAADQPATASPQKTGADAQEQEPGDDVYRHSPSVRMMGGWLHLDKEPAAEAFEYFNFAILAGAVLYALGRILPKTFRANRETIQHQLVDARTATQQANERLAAIEKRLGHLGEEIEAIAKQAEKDSAEDETRIKATIEEERRRIVDAVGKDIAAASSAAQRELKRFAAGLAIDRATQKLSLTEDDDRALLQEFAQTLVQHTHGRGES